MQIAVLGATGRTGSRILLFALEQGLHVVALVREEEKLYRVIGRSLTDDEANRLLLIQGDPTNCVDVEKTVKGADAVYETVGKLRDISRWTSQHDNGSSTLHF